MNRKTLPLCTLLLIASLASCAPTVQGPAGAAYQPNVAVGVFYVFSVHIPADQITDQTLDSTYASFDDCVQAGVSVADVRKLGVQAADQVCKQARGGTNTFAIVLGAIALTLGIIFAFMLSHLGDALSNPGTPAPARTP